VEGGCTLGNNPGRVNYSACYKHLVKGKNGY